MGEDWVKYALAGELSPYTIKESLLRAKAS